MVELFNHEGQKAKNYIYALLLQPEFCLCGTWLLVSPGGEEERGTDSSGEAEADVRAPGARSPEH